MITKRLSAIRAMASWVCVLQFAACGQGPEAAGRASDFAGTWEWISAFGGPMADTTTFGGDSATLELGADGTYQLEVAPGGLVQGTYRTEGTATSLTTGQAGPRMIFSPIAPFLGAPVFVAFVDGETLVLRTTAHDEFDFTFRRMTEGR